jgi:hypothetical protein
VLDGVPVLPEVLDVGPDVVQGAAMLVALAHRQAEVSQGDVGLGQSGHPEPLDRAYAVHHEAQVA